MKNMIDALVRRQNELKKQDDRGFSLVELLVVVLIIGVLAAIAIPMYLSSVASARQSAVEGAAATAKASYAAHLFEYETDTDPLTDFNDAVTDAIAETTSAEIVITSTGTTADTVQFVADHRDGPETATSR